MYRVFLFLGGLLCAAAMAVPLAISDVPLRTIPAQMIPGVLSDVVLLQYGVGALFLGVAIMDGATDTRRKLLSTFAIACGALAFGLVAIVVSMKVFDIVDVVTMIPTRYLLLGGAVLLVLASFGVKPSCDANLANMWLAIACIAFVGAILLGGTSTYILLFCAMMLLIVASLLITTEKRRDKGGAMFPNLAALAFVGSATILVVRISLGHEPQWADFGGSDQFVLASGAAFLAGWLMLLSSASSLKQTETGGNRFSAWLSRVSLLYLIVGGTLFYLAFKDTEFRTGLLPLAAVTVFFAAMPLLIIVAMFAVSEGARTGPGAALLELSAQAFAASTAAALILVSLITYPPTKEHSFTDPHLIAQVVAGVSLVGWLLMAFSAFGLRNRTE